MLINEPIKTLSSLCWLIQHLADNFGYEFLLVSYCQLCDILFN